ncbi:MAG: hypothetical protein RQ826_03030 [Xanthomonadales bacterium]|nr:hypothetical protein [Xanthomonadales bacterium]
MSSLPSIDRYAEREYETLFQRALVTFALARTLNGVISVVQGTELALQPAGVGVTLTPGEILDPVNDLVERFSWIMLGATLSLGIQQVVLDAGQWWPLRLAIGLLGLAWVGLRLRRGALDSKVQAAPVFERALLRLLIVIVFLRLAVPLLLIGNESLYRLFLEPRYVESSQAIEVAGSEIEKVGSVPLETEPAGGLFGSLERTLQSTRETLDVRQRVERIRARAAELVEHLIQLSVVFILQTAILPIAFLWLLLQLAKKTLRVGN